MRYLTAGESHGKGLTAILEGFPAGVPLSFDALQQALQRRASGYGRGDRQKIESDTLVFSAGVAGGVTTGAPISFFIENKDFKPAFLDPERGDPEGWAVTALRPGHADYAGMLKYGYPSARLALERASARETAARVGVGAICKELLKLLGIAVCSHVTAIGGVHAAVAIDGDCTAAADNNPVRCLDIEASERMCAAIDKAKADGDTLGGVVQVAAFGVPAGVGSFVHYDRKLDAQLTFALMSVQSVKGVSVGLGFAAADKPGSQVHDEMFCEGGKITRATNNAGGIEGGMSNGEPIVLTVACKPIPTLMRGLCSVDCRTLQPVKSAAERSDVCAVPAASVVCEYVTCFTLLNALLAVTGGDTLSEVKQGVARLRERTL